MMHENAERAGLIMKGLGRKAKATADGSHGYNKAIKNTRRSFDSVALCHPTKCTSGASRGPRKLGATSLRTTSQW
jgi:hypothetical protein